MIQHYNLQPVLSRLQTQMNDLLMVPCMKEVSLMRQHQNGRHQLMLWNTIIALSYTLIFQAFLLMPSTLH